MLKITSTSKKAVHDFNDKAWHGVDNDRGKGIGKALLQKAEGFGIKHGAHKVTLETGVDWTARKFYESLGYRVEAELPDHYFHHDFVIYTKYLTP